MGPSCGYMPTAPATLDPEETPAMPCGIRHMPGRLRVIGHVVYVESNPPRLGAPGAPRRGFSSRGPAVAQRVIVFLDWQNVYMRAREAFHQPATDPSSKGQVDPVDLAHVLTADYARRHPESTFELIQIRIYRGRPTQQDDPKGYAAFQRQDAQWARNNRIRPHYSDLRYPYDWGTEECQDKPREKGIDVALAVDLVTMSTDGAYEVAIVMSADYDLVPAIDYLVRRRLTRGDGGSVEVAAWQGDTGDKPLRIRLDGHSLYCIWLDRQAYWGVVDETDYTVSKADRANRRQGPIPGSWLRRS